MLYLNEAGINVLIKKNKANAIDMYWNNYSLMIWEKILADTLIQVVYIETVVGEYQRFSQ